MLSRGAAHSGPHLELSLSGLHKGVTDKITIYTIRGEILEEDKRIQRGNIREKSHPLGFLPRPGDQRI